MGGTSVYEEPVRCPLLLPEDRMQVSLDVGLRACRYQVVCPGKFPAVLLCRPHSGRELTSPLTEQEGDRGSEALPVLSQEKAVTHPKEPVMVNFLAQIDCAGVTAIRTHGKLFPRPKMRQILLPTRRGGGTGSALPRE